MEKQVKREGPLLEILLELFQELSAKKLKNYLKKGAILVNNQMITQYNYPVKPYDIIKIQKENKTHHKSPLKILYEDKDFLVVDKPPHLLSIATEKEKEKTAYHKMRKFIKNRHYQEKLFVLHRLDQETGGVLVFVKSDLLKRKLQENWNHLILEREYYALVHGVPQDKKDYICYLKEDATYQVSVTQKQKDAKKAITSFQVMKTNGSLSLLKVQIKTGRKNQIRAVLSYLGYPILGDKKYGGKKAERLFLQATCLKLKHPTTSQVYEFKSPLPIAFEQKLNQKRGKE